MFGFKKKKKIDQARDDVVESKETTYPSTSYKKPLYNNYKDNKYAERLIKDWLDHGKLIIALEFDDVLIENRFSTPEDRKNFDEVVKILVFAQSIGCYIAIWTSCSPDRYEFISDYCRFKGLNIDSINETPISTPYGSYKKIQYNWLLDSHAGLEQALDILNYACWRVKSEKKFKSENFDI